MIRLFSIEASSCLITKINETSILDHSQEFSDINLQLTTFIVPKEFNKRIYMLIRKIFNSDFFKQGVFKFGNAEFTIIVLVKLSQNPFGILYILHRPRHVILHFGLHNCVKFRLVQTTITVPVVASNNLLTLRHGKGAWTKWSQKIIKLSCFNEPTVVSINFTEQSIDLQV